MANSLFYAPVLNNPTKFTCLEAMSVGAQWGCGAELIPACTNFI